MLLLSIFPSCPNPYGSSWLSFVEVNHRYDYYNIFSCKNKINLICVIYYYRNVINKRQYEIIQHNFAWYFKFVVNLYRERTLFDFEKIYQNQNWFLNARDSMFKELWHFQQLINQDCIIIQIEIKTKEAFQLVKQFSYTSLHSSPLPYQAKI